MRIKLKWQRNLCILVTFMLFLGLVSPVYCATAESYKTKEYYASTGLDLINAAEAYTLGYTGKGILLGICDHYTKLSHPEFIHKLNSRTLMPVGDYDWTENVHGTLAGGIMAASKNNIGMHGVAFDADLLSGLLLDKSGTRNIQPTYDAFNKDSSIKIINNSWDPGGYIDEVGAGKEGVIQLLRTELDILENSIKNYDKVLVFAAGNFGHTSPGGTSILPYLKPQTAGNFISVISVDPAQYDKTTNTASNNFLSLYSNLSKYVEENSIAAPGYNIYTSIPVGDGYDKATGTSFAAPHVSGVTGLVQQAFPYLDGKQIVDTVLSTANRNFALPDYTITRQKDFLEESGGGESRCKINLYYFGNKPDNATIESNLSDYYNSNKEILKDFSYNSLQEFLAATRTVYDNVPREMIFGQGLLDAGAAVGGPGLLNARRLDNSNFSPASAYKKDQALYAVDTKGYDSIWSNNIGEKRAELLADHADSQYADLQAIYRYYKQGDVLYNFSQGQDYIDQYNARVLANGLRNLPVGLIKTGMGTLTLSGTNTYQGSSIAAGGVLQIDGKVAGDAFSVESGIISGSGTIQSHLYNQSVVQAGSYGNPGTLTVNGNFESNGKIAVAATANGYSKLEVGGWANIDGTSFSPVAGSVYQPDRIYSGVLTAGNITGNFLKSSFTGMLSATGSHNGTSAQLQLSRENNLSNPTARQLQAYSQMESMYNHLQGQSRQREMDLLYSLNSDQAKQALTEIYGGAQLNQAMITQRDTTIDKTITARLNSIKQPKYKQLASNLSGYLADNAVIPLELDDSNNWWVKITQSWGSIDAQQDLPKLDHRNFGFIVGQDKKASKYWQTGMFFSYGKNDVSSDLAKTKNQGYRLGMYAGYNQGAVDVQTHLDYGKHNNQSTRYLGQLGLQADSEYKSNTIGFGVAARYNLQQDKEKEWQVSPYADFNIRWYNQDQYKESGAGIYNQEADKLKNTYSTGEVGIELARNISKGGYSINLGYKKVLSGNNPDMTIAYSGNPGEKLKISGTEQDHEYMVVGVNFQGEIAKDWTLIGQIDNQMGKTSRNIMASLMVRRAW